MKKIRHLSLVGLSALTLSLPVFAAVSASEAAKLGKDLTLTGAETAGNAEGTIPAYTHGLTTPPETFKPGSGNYPNPFAGEKPLFTITSANVQQYASKLSAVQLELFKRYPETFKMDVYPTHRTVGFPEDVLKNTVANATNAKTTGGGLGIDGAFGGIPFPIPKTGNEVMWNHLLHYRGKATQGTGQKTYLVDGAGKAILTAYADYAEQFPYYFDKNATDAHLLRGDFKGPPRVAGEINVMRKPVDYTQRSERVWQYLSGQRRVRQAPDLAYDTPETSQGGGYQVWDEFYGFNGKMDRFDFKLVGKKEMYIPYNSYDLFFGDPSTITTPGHPRADAMRWELHRVWVVEANLKPGARHIYKTRRFYMDEDLWAIIIAESFDQGDQLYRGVVRTPVVLYDKNVPTAGGNITFDFQKRGYLFAQTYGEGKFAVREPWPDNFFTPASLSAGGVN
jgi:hypothetical protein